MVRALVSEGWGGWGGGKEGRGAVGEAVANGAGPTIQTGMQNATDVTA